MKVRLLSEGPSGPTNRWDLSREIKANGLEQVFLGEAY